jgi:hypothetical protein
MAAGKRVGQTKKMKKQFIISIVIIFVLLSAIFFAMKVYAPDFQFIALETGNVIMASLSLITYLMVTKQVDNRPHAFVRGVYSASFLKLMVCMISILVYVLLNRAKIHKPSVFVLFGIYVVYTIMETWILSRTVKE